MTAQLELEIDLDKKEKLILGAGATLRRIADDDLFFVSKELRHPLGIYNVSLARISDRTQKLSSSLIYHFEKFTSLPKPSKEKGSWEASLEEIEERLELLVYALAEHIDDCETILKTCFSSDRLFAKSSANRKFQTDIKPLRRHFSLLANAIKHNHQRVRFFTSEFRFRNASLVLIGFLLEKFSGSSVGPDPNFLGPNKKVASCTAFLWSSIVHLIRISTALSHAIEKSAKLQDLPVRDWDDHGAVRKVVGIRRGAISDNMRVSFQAARSIG